MQKDNAGKHEVVLIVDDDAGVKDFARNVLELRGHKVLTAGTRGDALILFDQWGSEITTVLLDTSPEEPVQTETLMDKIAEFNPVPKVIVTSIYNHGFRSTDLFPTQPGSCKSPTA